MPNHFHIFLKQTSDNKPISKFIGDLTNSYTKSINKKYGRSGVLFESRTKNRIVYEERAFPLLTKYILTNPVKANICSRFDSYDFSSAKELIGIIKKEITDAEILNYFENVEMFKEYILAEDEISLNHIFIKREP